MKLAFAYFQESHHALKNYALQVKADYAAPFRKYPVGRHGRPEKVGELVSWLASEESAFMTGSAIRFDGGRALV